jgi:hypothetical protein
MFMGGLWISKPSRYIPVGVKNVIRLENGPCCSFPGCRRPAVELHHTKRFALDPSCDPSVVKPLCRVHHMLCHGGADDKKVRDYLNVG